MDSYICPITQYRPTTPAVLNCGHVFDRAALNAAFLVNPSCPVCRSVIHTVPEVCILLRDAFNSIPRDEHTQPIDPLYERLRAYTQINNLREPNANEMSQMNQLPTPGSFGALSSLSRYNFVHQTDITFELSPAPDLVTVQDHFEGIAWFRSIDLDTSLVNPHSSLLRFMMGAPFNNNAAFVFHRQINGPQQVFKYVVRSRRSVQQVYEDLWLDTLFVYDIFITTPNRYVFYSFPTNMTGSPHNYTRL